jgi:hypothetical protein
MPSNRLRSVRSRLSTSLLQSCLLQDTVQGSWREIIARFARNRDESRLGCVLELSMRTTLPNYGPTVVLQHLDHVANLHN